LVISGQCHVLFLVTLSIECAKRKKVIKKKALSMVTYSVLMY